MVETETWKEYIETNDLLPIFKGSEEYTEYIKEAGNSYKSIITALNKNTFTLIDC